MVAAKPHGRGQDEMPTPLEKMPSWQRTIVEARRAAMDGLALEEQEAAKLAQKAARERAAARREASKRLAQKIYAMYFDGAHIGEIAHAVGRSISSVRQVAARWGFPISVSTQIRMIPVAVADARAAALDRASADYGTTRAQTLEDAMTFLLDEDALALRRLLHIRRREAGAALTG